MEKHKNNFERESRIKNLSNFYYYYFLFRVEYLADTCLYIQWSSNFYYFKISSSIVDLTTSPKKQM